MQRPPLHAPRAGPGCLWQQRPTVPRRHCSDLRRRPSGRVKCQIHLARELGKEFDKQPTFSGRARQGHGQLHSPRAESGQSERGRPTKLIPRSGPYKHPGPLKDPKNLPPQNDPPFLLDWGNSRIIGRFRFLGSFRGSRSDCPS